MSRVSVVILNYNGRSFLEQFLPSVIRHTPESYEIIVADNASTDDSLAFLESAYPSVRVIRNNKNGGFSQGYNDSLKQVNAEYYVLLNSDVEVTEGWCEPVIHAMSKDPRIAAAQPKIKSFQDRSRFDYAGAAGGFIDQFGYPFCRGRIFDEIEKDQGQYNDQRLIFWATGACLFVKAEVYHKAGGLDEDFFAHMEEIDLCWRIRNMGFEIIYVPGSEVYHVGGGTLSRQSPRKTYLNFRNNLYLLFKNHPSHNFFLKLVFRFHLDWLAALKFLVSGEAAHFSAVMKAHFSFLKSLGDVRRKRKQVKKLITRYDESCIYNGSIVWDYFVKKLKTFDRLPFSGKK